ncbi:MAG: sialate O-acetylesterase [Planctomycetes bacterium]|nr:sialate O-acetylesterase [Planctomycetota bacterium]
MSKTRFATVLILLACGFGAALIAGFSGNLANEVEQLPPKEAFHLYLLIGQSNMAGRVPVQRRDRVPDPRVLMLDDQDRWVLALDPVHTDKSIAGVGLCRSFARVLTDEDQSITIGLIPCSVGGSALRQWEQGEAHYESAVSRTQLAMANGTLRGILWHQGESDTLTLASAQTYEQRLIEMIHDMRTDLGAPAIPFLIGELGEFLVRDPNRPYAFQINRALFNVAAVVPNTGWIDAHGLDHVGDQVHFDRRSLNELGRRYAHAMMQLYASEVAVPSSDVR